MHISYFIYTYSIRGFIKSLLALPGRNAQGMTSKQSNRVPWGSQYRVNGVYCLYYEDYDEEYEEYDDSEDYEEQTVEYLAHKGWVQL